MTPDRAERSAHIAAQGRDARANYSIAPTPSERLEWDALQIALAILLLIQVWGVQYLFPMLGVHGLLILAVYVTVLLLVLDRDPRRRLSRFNDPVVRAALGLLVLATLSIPGSLDPPTSLEVVLGGYLRAVVLMLLVAGSVRGVADLRRLAWLQIAGLTLFCVVGTARSRMVDGRLSITIATNYDVNEVALLIASTLPLVVYLWRPPTGLWARRLLVVATVFLLFTLERTGSRGGFLALLAVVACLLLWFRGISRAKRVGAVALLAIMLVALANTHYVERIQTILHPSTDYNWSGRAETGRMEVWKRGLGYMLDHPVLGVGAGAFAVAEGTLAPGARVQQYGRKWRWSVAHNSLIDVGAELGVPGLILFVALLMGAFRTLSNVRRRAPGEGAFLAQALMCSLVGFLVAAMFLSEAVSCYFYTLLGMSLGLAKVAA